VQAALEQRRLGLIDNWLRHVQDVMKKHRAQLYDIPDPRRRLDRLCELNVIEQVLNVGETTIVQSAWDRGKALEIHGWVYGLDDGLLKDLSVCVKSREEFAQVYRSVVESR
jgi:carbonic anhydrase